MWFTDLAAADSTMILPIANAVSFLLMIELGADGMASSDQDKFKWVMRGLAFIMTPITMSLPQGIFVYWTTNNAISVTQAIFLKAPPVRKYFQMPEPPKESGATGIMSESNPVMATIQSIKKEFSKTDMKAEIVDAGESRSMPLVKPLGPAPVTSVQRPKKKK